MRRLSASLELITKIEGEHIKVLLISTRGKASQPTSYALEPSFLPAAAYSPAKTQKLYLTPPPHPRNIFGARYFRILYQSNACKGLRAIYSAFIVGFLESQLCGSLYISLTSRKIPGQSFVWVPVWVFRSISLSHAASSGQSQN